MALFESIGASLGEQAAREVTKRLLKIEEEQVKLLKAIQRDVADLKNSNYVSGREFLEAACRLAGSDRGRAITELENARERFYDARGDWKTDQFKTSLVAAHLAFVEGQRSEAEHWAEVAQLAAVATTVEACEKLNHDVANRHASGWAKLRPGTLMAATIAIGIVFDVVVGGVLATLVACAVVAVTIVVGERLLAVSYLQSGGKRVSELASFVEVLGAFRRDLGVAANDVPTYKLTLPTRVRLPDRTLTQVTYTKA